MPSPTTEHVAARAPSQLKADATERATAQGHSLSSVLLLLLEGYVSGQFVLPSQEGGNADAEAKLAVGKRVVDGESVRSVARDTGHAAITVRRYRDLYLASQAGA